MKLIVKLAAVVLVPSIALGGLGAAQVWSSWTKAQSMARIESLSELAVDISSLVHETQKERGRTAGFLGSKGKKFVSEIAQQRSLTDERQTTLRASLETLDRGQCDVRLLSLLDAAVGRLDDLPKVRKRVSSLDISAGDAIGHYTKMNADFLNAIGAIAAHSDDPALNTNLLAYSMFLKSKERAGIERAVMSNTFARDSFGPGMYNKFISLMSQQDTYLKEFRNAATDQAEGWYGEAATNQAFAGVVKMRKVALDNAAEGGFDIDPGVWFSTITQKINALKGVEDQLAQGVAQQAGTVRAAATTKMRTDAAILLGVLGITFVLGTLIARSTAKRVTSISEQITAAEHANNLTVSFDEAGSDEISDLAGSFNRFIGKLHNMVSDVGRVSEEVAGAATEMAATTDEFARGLGEQSSQTNEAAAAIEQLAGSVRSISEHGAEAAEAAEFSRSDAEQGGKVVAQTVEEIQAIASDVRDSAQAINELGKRSEQIGQIIGVINDIADQTNLLALNAAIEAARAGEHGRGFAVVADEVRKLAERTGDATKEVTDAIGMIQTDTKAGVDRIESSVGRVDSGVELASSAGEALDRIVSAAQGLGQMVGSISQAAREQSVASDDLAQRIDAIRSVTSEATTAASQSAEASGNMSHQAERLRELVGSFKI